MTDNGSSGGCKTDTDGFVNQGYNARMRGKKGSFYDGGHRVPFFVRWPAGGVTGGFDIDDMTLHVDVLPTLVDLCALSVPSEEASGSGNSDASGPPTGADANASRVAGAFDLSTARDLPRFDGDSLAPLLEAAGTGSKPAADTSSPPLPAADRVHFVQFDMAGREVVPKWNVTVMSGKWRLVYGRELYDVASDPEQRHDVAPQNKDVVKRLRGAHEAWWPLVEPGIQEYNPIVIGSDEENPTRLDAFDVMGDLPYVQSLVARGGSATGIWTVDVAQAGRYRFRLRRWPEELDLSIESDLSPEAVKDLIIYREGNTSTSIQPVSARIGLFGSGWTRAVSSREKEAWFEVDIEQVGRTLLEAWFVDADGNELGAYYVYIERL
jgi:hypothetical protein